MAQKRRHFLLKLADGLSALLLCAVPGLAMLALVHGLLGASLADYRPRSWDELDYWHEIATFGAVGWQGGHYGLEGGAAPTARLGGGSFGPHGVWPSVVYGLPARIFGWDIASPPFYNIAAMTAGLAAMVLCMRPGWAFSLKAAALLASYGYIGLYAPVMLLESMVLGLCFAMAGLFHRLMAAYPRRGWSGTAWTLAGVITLATLVRYYYGLLFFGLLLFTEDPRTWRQWLGWALKGFGLMALATAAYQLTMAPFPYDAFPGSIFGPKLYVAVLHGRFDLLLHHLRLNWDNTFYPADMTPYHVLFLAIITCAVAFPLLTLAQASRSANPAVRRLGLLTAGWHGINIGGGLAILFLYYYTMISDFGTRILTPSLLLSALIMLRRVPGLWWAPLVALNLVLAPAFLRDCRSLLQGHFEDIPSDIAQRETEALWRAHLRYDATARNPWCNTLQTVGFFNFDGQLAVPAGLGINETRQAAEMAPPKAGHVLAKGAEALEAMAARPALVPVVSGPDWTLYRNTAAGCAETGQDRK